MSEYVSQSGDLMASYQDQIRPSWYYHIYQQHSGEALFVISQEKNYVLRSLKTADSLNGKTQLLSQLRHIWFPRVSWSYRATPGDFSIFL